jgi:hypothetical protein
MRTRKTLISAQGEGRLCRLAWHVLAIVPVALISIVPITTVHTRGPEQDAGQVHPAGLLLLRRNIQVLLLVVGWHQAGRGHHALLHHLWSAHVGRCM